MSSTSTAAASAAAHFVEKWWRREPEMRIAAVFCARADANPGNADAGLRFTAWGALLHELREALFEISDPGVAAAKRGWWAEELQLLAQGGARHPLAQALAQMPEAKSAPWTGLALALLGFGGDERSADTAQALAALRPLAQATLLVENALFHVPAASAADADALAVHWLLHRLPAGLAEEDGARVPMHLLARHGLTKAQLCEAPQALLREWSGELLRLLPARGQGAFLRRASQRFDAARLRLLAKGGGSGHPEAREAGHALAILAGGAGTVMAQCPGVVLA